MQQIWTNDAAADPGRGAEGRMALAGRIADPGALGVVVVPAGSLAGDPEARGRPRRIVCCAPSPSAAREEEA